VKHDREANFARANLITAVTAVCGVAAMLFAQFGKDAFHNPRELNSFFELVEAPKWDLSEVYPTAKPGDQYTAKTFPGF